MEPEITLLTAGLITLLFFRIKDKRYEWMRAGRAGMSAMLLLTGIAHFVFTPGMVLMLPGFIPFPVVIIYITGVLELLAAVCLQWPRHRRQTGILLILFFILLLPANIYAAFRHINMEAATFDGAGPGSLWYRIPMQFVFIAWVYFAAVRKAGSV